MPKMSNSCSRDRLKMSTTGNITLRPFNDFTDRKLLRQWLSQEYIYKWWGDPEREYRHCITHPNGGRGVVICVDEKPIGYIYVEPVIRERLDALGLQQIPDGAIDLDIFIGERDYLGFGIAARALKLLLEELFADPDVPMVGLTTSIENTRAQTSFQTAGFRTIREIEDDEYGRCLVMVATRNAVSPQM